MWSSQNPSLYVSVYLSDGFQSMHVLEIELYSGENWKRLFISHTKTNSCIFSTVRHDEDWKLQQV